MNWNLSNDALTFIAVSLIAFGLVKCFYGYRIFKFILALTGFIVGASAAGTAAALASPDNPEIAALLAGLIGGVVMGFLSFVLYFVGVFLFGAFIAASASSLLLLGAGGDTEPAVVLLLSLVFGLTGGILALVFQKFLIIVSTAFGGALTSAIGASHFFVAHLRIGGPEDIEYLIRSLLSGHIFFLLGVTALGLTGAVFQYLNNARKAPATDGDSEDKTEGGTDSETAPAPAQSPPLAPARSPDTATPRATPAKPAKPAPTDNYFVDGD